MLPAAQQHILATLPDDALVLDVGGWAAPFRRADWVLDAMPHATRGAMGSYGDGPERFANDTWVVRDICDREPWPFADGQFDFALCVTTLEDVRDPVWVCSELSRVARAGYVEVPTLVDELTFNVSGRGPWLGHDHHRWLCELEGGELVFTHKPHSIHHDWTLRVGERWARTLRLEDRLLGHFWRGTLAARERLAVTGYPTDAWRAAIRARFRPSPRELAARRAAERARHGARLLVERPARRAAQALLSRRR